MTKWVLHHFLAQNDFSSFRIWVNYFEAKRVCGFVQVFKFTGDPGPSRCFLWGLRGTLRRTFIANQQTLSYILTDFQCSCSRAWKTYLNIHGRGFIVDVSESFLWYPHVSKITPCENVLSDLEPPEKKRHPNLSVRWQLGCYKWYGCLDSRNIPKTGVSLVVSNNPVSLMSVDKPEVSLSHSRRMTM